MRASVTRSVMQTPEGFWTFAFMRVTNFDGTWINLGALAVGDRVLNFPNTITWGDDIDRNTPSMTATFKREIGVYSLVPFRSDSPLNVDDLGTTYQPLLDLSREWELMGVILPIGTYPASEADYRPFVAGICTRIDVQTEPATITVQGNGHEVDLIDRRILFVDNTADPPVSISETTPKVYAGGALDTVLQAILDDELGTGVVTLTVDGSAPSFYVNGWNQTTDVGLFDLLQQVAGLAGAQVRYRYDASDVLTLTLFAPDRNATAPTWQIDGNEYEKLDAGIDRAGIRNFVVVTYADDNFGIQTVTSPVDVPPTSASISRYGLRPLVISLASTTQITAQADAGNLADAIRSDLEFPIMEQQVQGVGLWFAELGDFVQLVANGIHYDEDQYGGITGYSHTFANGELVSTINLRGQPAGRYRTWLNFGPGKPRTPYTPEITSYSADYWDTYSGGVLVAGGIGDIGAVNAYVQSVVIDVGTDPLFATLEFTEYTSVTPGGSFTHQWGGASRGTIYYFRATPWSGPLVAGVPSGVAGPAVFARTYNDQLRPTQAQYDTIVDTIGDLAGSLGAIGIPTVFVNVTEDDQWLGLSTIPTSETEVGTEYRRQRYLVGAGSVRLNAVIKTLTGTPTVKLKYSVNAFGAVADLVTWTPAGTGLRTSAWATIPTGAKADVGLTVYVADGADTAVLDLYELDAEFLPATVAGGRVHTAAFAPAFD